MTQTAHKALHSKINMMNKKLIGSQLKHCQTINIGRKHTVEIRQKQSEICKGIKRPSLSEEHKEKIRKMKTGSKHTDETKRRMSKAHKGHTTSEETKAKISIANIGRKHTGQAYENIVASLRKTILASDFKQKCRNRQLGKKDSEETKRRKSEALKNYWAKQRLEKRQCVV